MYSSDVDQIINKPTLIPFNILTGFIECLIRDYVRNSLNWWFINGLASFGQCWFYLTMKWLKYEGLDIFWNVWKSSILHQSFHIHVYSIWQFSTYFRLTANGNAFKYKWVRGCVQTDLFVLSFWVQVGNLKTNSFKNRQREWSYLCMSSSNKELWVY